MNLANLKNKVYEQMPKVSVIIPTFNCGSYISEGIDSALNQTFKDFEIIIVDDGSTDNTKEIVQEYIEKHPKIIKYFYQSNQGVASARNKGIMESKGEYIAILEADDVWLPEKIRMQVKILNENSDAAMVYTDAEMFEGDHLIRASLCHSTHANQKIDGFRKKIQQCQFNDGTILKESLFDELLFGNLIVTLSVVMRKNCLSDVGNFDSHLAIDDYDYWIRISEKFPIIYLNKITTRYRYRENSLSGKNSLRSARYNEFGAKAIEKVLKKYPNKKNILAKRISLLYRTSCWSYLNNLNLDKTREMAFKSLCYYGFQPKLYLYILISFLPVNFVRLVKKIKNILCQKLV